MASKIRGIISTRRLIRRLPDLMRDELGRAMQDAGPVLAAAMEAKAPRRTGHLIAGIGWKFYPKSLRLVVGFLGKRLNRELFYARILEFGRKAQTVTVSRRKVGVNNGLRGGRKKFEDIASTYRLRVKARPAAHFVYGPATNLRRTLNRRLNGIWDRVLRRASGGDNE